MAGSPSPNRRISSEVGSQVRGQVRFRAAFDHAPIGMALVDTDGRWLEVNGALCSILGYGADELVRLRWQALTHPDDVETDEALVEELRTGAIACVQREKRLVRSDGRPVWVQLSVSLIPAGTDSPLCFVHQVQDISARKHAELVSMQQALVFDALHDAVVVTDLHGRITELNPAAAAVFGLAPSELIGKPVSVLIAEDTRSLREMLREMGRALRSTGRWAGEVRFRRTGSGAGGSEAGVAEIIVVTLRGGDRWKHAYVAVARDVTEARRLEVQFRQAQKLEAIGQLAAGIAHEINTPTQYVGDNVRFLESAFTDLLGLLGRWDAVRERLADHPEISPPGSEFASELARAAAEADLPYLVAEIPLALGQSLEGLERIAEIVRGVRAFAHPGADSMESVDLNREIENTVSVSRNEWRYEAEVNLELAADLPLVHCLAGEINQVVLNLIVNAAHAIADRRRTESTEEKGLITIRTRHLNDQVEIRVSDTGTGMPEHVRERIFDPFFTTKEVGRGTGQGLTIARTVVVERHGGTIDIETEVGVGTKFIVRLPLVHTSRMIQKVMRDE